MGRSLFTGAVLFDGEAFLDGEAVLVEDGSVVALCPASEAVAADAIIELKGGVLAPGFIDVQVNGGGGVLFNETPTVDGVRAIADAHRSFGVTAILPTLITDAPEKTRTATAAVKDAIAAGCPGCLGVHLEGPFISPARKGAHKGDHIRPMSDADVDVLLGLDIDTVLVTLAPEAVPPELIRRLSDGGIIVSLGHSDATYDEVARAVDAGARGVTHLFNAMSPLSHGRPEWSERRFNSVVCGAASSPTVITLTLPSCGLPCAPKMAQAACSWSQTPCRRSAMRVMSSR